MYSFDEESGQGWEEMTSLLQYFPQATPARPSGRKHAWRNLNCI